MVLEHLEMAERHVREGDEHIALQEQRIAKLRLLGGDTAAAEALLKTMHHSQVLHVEGRELIRQELEQAE